jgi:hypothetical protein
MQNEKRKMKSATCEGRIVEHVFILRFAFYIFHFAFLASHPPGPAALRLATAQGTEACP